MFTELLYVYCKQKSRKTHRKNDLQFQIFPYHLSFTFLKIFGSYGFPDNNLYSRFLFP